jgi:hypothetical protein
MSPAEPCASAMMAHTRSFLLALAISVASAAIGLMQGCGGTKGVAEVPECRSVADSVRKSQFETGVDYLRRQADAYSDCMIAHDYVFDQAQLDEKLNHIREVQNADVMGGDPFYVIAKRRQELRMSPALWRRVGS